MSDRLTKEEKLKIIEHFLLSTPPGEFEDVLADVKELVDDKELINQQALDTFRKYNLDQLIPVEVEKPESHKLILSTYGELKGDKFMDPRYNQIVTVNHALGKVVGIENGTGISETIKKRRVALQESCDKYVKDRYVDGISTVFPSKEKENEFFVCICTSKFNQKNFWSGRWRSVYRITFNSDTKLKISGSMKVNVHYYEKGNVQLNTSREFGDDVSVQSSSKLADKLFKTFEKAEGEFQEQIDQTCRNLSNIFKLLRRRLPITGTLFKFNTKQHDIIGSYQKKK